MTIMEMLVPFGLLLVFLIMSIVLLQGKGAMFIAGYNTMSTEDKATYDEVALCKATGKMMLGVSFSIALIFAGGAFALNWLLIIGTIVMVLSILIGLIYMNTGNRYQIHKDEKKSKKEV